ncbi:Cdc37 N terminal kinase binding-domain-containing protein [Gorgonomyces haynaldii]|nr:Cdc37 N terminal kinase binding-domain-containing protein [Gorgonomyces haynaldii]
MCTWTSENSLAPCSFVTVVSVDTNVLLYWLDVLGIEQLDQISELVQVTTRCVEDYSKWDKLELSDDEDFECHPNVDKKSMVRWKQAQIHKERREREDQVVLLKMEHENTVKFLKSIPDYISTIQKFKEPEETLKIVDYLMRLGKEVEDTLTDPMRKESLGRINNWPGNWDPPVWCDTLRSHVPWHEEIASILKKGTEYTQEHKDTPDFKLGPFICQCFQETHLKFSNRQPLIEKQLKEFEDKMNAKITMDHLKTGFSKTTLTHKDNVAAPAADSQPSKSRVIETIHTPKEQVYDGLEAEIMEELQASDQDLKQTHPKLLDFSKLRDFGDILNVLKSNPQLQEEKNEEILLMRALSLEIILKKSDAKNCVMLSLVLKYTRSLGPGGIDVFFSKLQSGSQNAQTMFFRDIESTYQHISTRGAILRAEHVEQHKKRQEEMQKVLENYKRFQQPDGTLKFPLGSTPSEDETKKAQWFDKGLLLGDVDKINQFLGTLEKDETEHHAQMAVECGFIQVEEEQ